MGAVYRNRVRSILTPTTELSNYYTGCKPTLMNSSIPSGRVVLLSLFKYSMMSLVCNEINKGGYTLIGELVLACLKTN